MSSLRLPFLFVLVTIILRLVPHVPNAAPVGALALLLGATLPKKTAVIATMITMIATDYFVGFHDVIFWVYGSYALITLLSKKISNMHVGAQITSSLTASLLFYLITNFGVWATTTMYEKNLAGLVASYTNGLPFLRNTILGDALYTLTFFALYAIIAKNTNKAPTQLPSRMYANSL